MLLRIDAEERGDTLHVRMAGEFDVSSVDRFKAALDGEHGGWRIAEIDLCDLVFMDSAALGALLGLNERARDEGREVYLVRPSHPVARLLQLTGLDRRFAVRD